MPIRARAAPKRGDPLKASKGNSAGGKTGEPEKARGEKRTEQARWETSQRKDRYP